MKTIKVTLDYKSSDDSLSKEVVDGMSMSIPFPVQVLDLQGAVVAEGAVDSHESVYIKCEVNADAKQLLVRLLWPTGDSVVQVAELDGKDVASVVFSDSNFESESWAKWSASRRFTKTKSRAKESTKEQSPSLEKFKNVWVRLWQCEPGVGWRVLSELPRIKSNSSETLKQIDLKLDQASYLLQLGGNAMPFTFVTLPGGGLCRVLLTPNVATDARSLPLRVVVSGFRPEAEMVAEFLARDSLQAARALMADSNTSRTVSPWNERDSMSAIVGAYMRLRTGGALGAGSEGEKFESFLRRNSRSADAALIGCVAELRAGLKRDTDVIEVFELLSKCHQRGMPVFEEGHRLMAEATTLLQTLFSGSSDTQGSQVVLPKSLKEYKPVLAACQRLTAARAWTGMNFSFFGRYPESPSPLQERGAAPPPEDSSPQEPTSKPDSRSFMFSRSEVTSSSVRTPRARSPKKRDFEYLKNL